jgi:hypothetical protein
MELRRGVGCPPALALWTGTRAAFPRDPLFCTFTTIVKFRRDGFIAMWRCLGPSIVLSLSGINLLIITWRAPNLQPRSGSLFRCD